MQSVVNAASVAHSGIVRLPVSVSRVLPTMPFKVLRGFGQQLDAFHAYSSDSTRHVHATHICNHLTPDLHQCLIFDGNGEGVEGGVEGGLDGKRLIGIEYLVTEKLFKTLPEEEKKYWHSHKAEVECGLLQIAGLKSIPTGGPVADSIEQPIMIELHQTYGKTIHTWQYDKHPDLPLGPPQLMMSYSASEQVPQDLVDKRDKTYFSPGETERKRELRSGKDGFLDTSYEPDPEAGQTWKTGKGIDFQPLAVEYDT